MTEIKAREIKFRVWDNDQMKFYYFDLTDDPGAIPIIVSFGAPVNQFTGLQDKNEKDIYEADILRVYGEFRTVEFKNSFWNFKPFENEQTGGGFGTATDAGHKPLYRYNDIEIVGNIYENTNLLNHD